ncbi:hypothetical protein GCM10027418_02430 [Mariniluteicoccus endophyticus]
MSTEPGVPELSDAQRAAEATTARLFRPVAFAGPFLVLGALTLFALGASGRLPDPVAFTNVSRVGGHSLVARDDVWWRALVMPAVLSFVALVVCGAALSTAEKVVRVAPGAAWASVAAFSWGLPLLAAWVPFTDIATQVGSPVAHAWQGWFLLAPVIAIGAGLLLVRVQRRWAARLADGR